MPDARNATLETWLRSYVPWTPEEIAHKQRMLALLREGEPALSRVHVLPGHFTASAFVLAPDREALLLIHHARLERWLQPGGHIEAGDPDLLASARRELCEEVGIAAAALEAPGIFDLDIHAIPAFRHEPAHQHFDVRFLFRAATRELRISSEAHAAQWVAFAAIDPAVADASVVRVLRKLRQSRTHSARS